MEYSYSATKRGIDAIENPEKYSLTSDEHFHLVAFFYDDGENVLAHGYQLQPSEKEVVNELVKKRLVQRISQPSMQGMM